MDQRGRAVRTILCGLLVAVSIGGEQNCVRERNSQAKSSVVQSSARPTISDNAKLFQAIKEGDAELVRRLIIDGVDVNAMNRWGDTPLNLAVAKQNQSIVNALIDGKAEIDGVGTSNQTALMIAAKFGDAGMVKLLLDRGSDPSITDKDDRNEIALHMVVREDRIDAVKVLIPKTKNIDAQNSEGSTPLALATGNRRIAELLINAGANANIPNRWGGTVLMSAIGNIPLMRLLINHGADVNAKDEDGWTVLKTAYSTGCPKAIAILKAAARKE
jgi:ankyrin repeat protein